MYVFDTNTLIIIFSNIYESRFPSFWKQFNESVDSGRIISVREVFQEISLYHNKDSNIFLWAKKNRDIFLEPSEEEYDYVKEIYQIERFRLNISKKSQLEGKPVADPFLVAKSRSISGCVVTQEKYKGNSARIPNICEYFNVKCVDLEGFMEIENWEY